MDLRLSVADRRVEDTGAFRTAVGQPLRTSHGVRIAPGAPDRSGVAVRMSQRGTGAPMPPIASEAIDRDGLAIVRAWIESLCPAAAATPWSTIGARHREDTRWPTRTPIS